MPHHPLKNAGQLTHQTVAQRGFAQNFVPPAECPPPPPGTLSPTLTQVVVAHSGPREANSDGPDRIP